MKKLTLIFVFLLGSLSVLFSEIPKKSWCIDGEKLEPNSQNKYNIEIANKVKILIPKKNINKLFINNT